jgi:hypothetical protein
MEIGCLIPEMGEIGISLQQGWCIAKRRSVIFDISSPAFAT